MFFEFLNLTGFQNLLGFLFSVQTAGKRNPIFLPAFFSAGVNNCK
jgi:hypothetical protein